MSGRYEPIRLYVELNPVRARLRRRPETHPWSSARAHLAGEDDSLVTIAPLRKMVPDWADFLVDGLTPERAEDLRRGERTGRPLGDKRFSARLERRVGRTLTKGKPGPRPKNGGDK